MFRCARWGNKQRTGAKGGCECSGELSVLADRGCFLHHYARGALCVFTSSFRRKGYESRAQPREKWHYRYIEGLGPNIDFELLDSTGSGDYRLTTPLEERAKLIGKLPYNLPYNLGKLDRGVASEGVEHIVIHIGPLPQ